MNKALVKENQLILSNETECHLIFFSDSIRPGSLAVGGRRKAIYLVCDPQLRLVSLEQIPVIKNSIVLKK